MSQGIAIAVSVGKVHKNQVYVKLKNKSVYKLNSPAPLTNAAAQKLVESITEHKKVKLKYWRKVR